MMRSVATYLVNRLMLLGVALVGLQMLGRNSCGVGMSLADRVVQTLPGLQQLARALQ